MNGDVERDVAPEFRAEFRAHLRDLFVWRRDVRRFKHEPLLSGALERLIETACLAPSVGLSQPWRFVVVDNPSRRDAIRGCFERCNAEALQAQEGSRAELYARLKLAGLDDAPCQVAVFADPTTTQGHGLGRRTMPETIAYSAVMAVHTFWLAARAENIGVGWVSILDPADMATILDVPPHWMLIAYLCIGYPGAEHISPALEQQGWERRRAPGAEIIRR